MDLLDWRLEMQAYAGTALTGAIDFVSRHPSEVTMAAIGSLALIGLGALVRHVRSDKVIEGDVNEMRKRVMLDEKYADMIGDGLFEMLCRDEIDRHEYKKACRRFGLAYRLSDLLVANNKKRGIKKRVHANAKSMKLLDPSGEPIQPNIPGPKPAEVVPVPQMKRSAPKRWIAKGKSLLHRVA